MDPWLARKFTFTCVGYPLTKNEIAAKIYDDMAANHMRVKRKLIPKMLSHITEIATKETQGPGKFNVFGLFMATHKDNAATPMRRSPPKNLRWGSNFLIMVFWKDH